MHVEGGVPRLSGGHHFLDATCGEGGAVFGVFPSSEAVAQVGIDQHVGDLVANGVAILLGSLPHAIHELLLSLEAVVVERIVLHDVDEGAIGIVLAGLPVKRRRLPRSSRCQHATSWRPRRLR